ncbi:MAG TPA: glycoside hydrolase family 15 protein [Gaiellaceae bacterium]|nr:glycoside hydrolase family 15 protein [Gaiellaceae bacterium]
MNLAARSVEVILAGQSPTGAYVACPNFHQYRFSWLRDGCFIADAMREAGEVASCDGFLDWCARIVMRSPEGPFDARYTLAGERDPTDWPRRQIDGWGLFLGTIRRRGSTRWDDAAAHVARWLGQVWDEPSVDWWEERAGLHAATLWCVGNGLQSDTIRRAALDRARDRLDGSLLFIGTPELVAWVEESLVSPGGGVWRNLDDEFYGGGEWLLLTAMLGLAKPERAEESLRWIEAHARPNGDLPEQSQDHLLRPDLYDPWVERWGEPPCPLLWSHAMYLRLHHALRDRR